VSTWRKHRFEPGKKYRVARDIRTEDNSVFHSGEIVEFVDAQYSRYDGSTAFWFTSVDTQEPKNWFLKDDAPDISDELFILDP